MSDSDDWETDADYENNLTEQQKRFAGRADVLHDLERQRSAGGVTMEGVRANAFAQDARAADAAFRRDGRRVLNATRGGKLEVFERVDHDDLF